MTARVVAEHQLPYGGSYDLPLPRGSVALKVAVVHGVITMWTTHPAAADVKDPTKRTVHVVTTGTVLTGDAAYVGTVLVDNGYTVAHVFLEPEA